MWGNHRRTAIYYCCQPTHQRSANPPAGHPKTVYLNEAKLNTALFGYLRGALFGPDRIEYWSRYRGGYPSWLSAFTPCPSMRSGT